MSHHIPGAPNATLSFNKVVMDEIVDKGAQNFHHAALVNNDEELWATTDITQIVPYVYIGSWDNSVDLDLLKHKNIKFALNVTEQTHRKETLDHMVKLGITADHLSLENLPESNLMTILPSSFAFIKRAVDNKRNVLIYCHQGMSTSAAIVSYFILKNFYALNRPVKNMLALVIEKIRSKRGYLDINFGFIEQLEDIEARLSDRPVIDKMSMSVRRNKELKATINRQMANNIAHDRAVAEKEYKITSKHRY